MTPKEQLSALEELAQSLSVRVSYEPFGASTRVGGLCKVRGEYRIILDRRLQPRDRAAVLASQLRRFAPDTSVLPGPVQALLAS